MAYQIVRTDGITVLGTILDGTFDDRSATSLQLVGRNYANYGQLMTNNLVSLLENWANTTAPPNPLSGQLWYNTTDKRLRVYTGTEFKVISSASAQNTPPNTPVAGDLWWDLTNKQLYVYDGTVPYSVSGWILIGPERDNSGAKWEQIADTLSTLHTVVSIYISGTRVAIVNSDPEWTPLTPITGFTVIKPGYNVASPGIFNGTANNSIRLDGVASSGFLRSDQNDSTTGSLTIENNAGLTIGLQSNLAITTETNGDARLTNLRQNSNIIFTGATGSGSIDLLNLDAATNQGVINSLVISGTASANSSTTGALVVAGGLGAAGKLVVAGGADLSGLVTAATAPLGTANTMVATTEFVVNYSGFLTNKIYAGGNASLATTYIDVNDTGVGNARIVIDGETVATASALGLNLANGATAATQPDTYNGTGNTRIATTQFVKTATQWWGGSKKYVSSNPPSAGVNDTGSVDGDFWFQYIP